MSYWLHFLSTDEGRFLSIAGKVLLSPVEPPSLTSIAEGTSVVIDKPALGRILPYIYVKNLFGKISFTVSASQEMANSYELVEETIQSLSGEKIQEYGLYRIKYRAGQGLKKYPHNPKRGLEWMDIWIIDEVLYRGERVLKSFNWAPMCDREGVVNEPGWVCKLMHEMIKGVGEEISERNPN